MTYDKAVYHLVMSFLVVCIPPLTPTNGELVKSADGMVVNYTCKSGYSLEGVATRHCQSDGSGWDESSPTCSKNMFLIQGFGLCFSRWANLGKLILICSCDLS